MSDPIPPEENTPTTYDLPAIAATRDGVAYEAEVLRTNKVDFLRRTINAVIRFEVTSLDGTEIREKDYPLTTEELEAAGLPSQFWDTLGAILIKAVKTKVKADPDA